MNRRSFLHKHEDGNSFGPVQLDQIAWWMAAAQIVSDDTLSSDQHTSIKAPMLPQLGKDWLIGAHYQRLIRTKYKFRSALRSAQPWKRCPSAQERIRDLEQTLQDERRALVESEQRYAELERKYQDLLLRDLS